MRHTFPAVAAAILAAGIPATAQQVQVLDQIIWAETRMDGEKLGEFSALVADPQGGGVLAISDRGYILRITVDATDGRLTRLDPVSLHLLTGSDGIPLRDSDFNPEGAALLANGTIAIVSEAGARLAVFDTEGHWLRDEVLPEPLRDPSLQTSDKDGVEALAWTEATGFIAATEEPQAGQPRDLHTLHGITMSAVEFTTAGLDDTSIKALETDDDRLIVLERSRDDATGARQPWIRILPLGDCATDLQCAGPLLRVPVEHMGEADFEGLAALGGDRFLVVSDDKIDGDLRSVFVLIEIK